MIFFALLLACEEGDQCLSATVSKAGNDGVGIELDAEPGRIGARLVRPEDALIAQAVVVHIFGGWFDQPYSASADVVPEGAVVIRPALAGDGWGDGEDDRRGPLGRAAVAAALRFAAGVDRDAAGCSLKDRAPLADPEQVILFGMSNGGNLALATLADSELEVPEPEGVVVWETPAGPQFVGHEFRGDDSLYEPGACTLDDESGIVCALPAVGFGEGEDGACFDVDGDGGCFEENAFGGTVNPATGLRVLSPVLLAAAEAAGVQSAEWASVAESEAFWAERDAARAADEVVTRFPDLPFLLLASTSDHAIPELEDHPHVFGLGEALQRAGAAWTRLNPGRAVSGLAEEGEANAPMELASAEGWLMEEEEESPLREPLSWAVRELLLLP